MTPTDRLAGSDTVRLDGTDHPVTFKAWDRNTYEHKPGCLAYGIANGACQCGALDRTSRIYESESGVVVLVPASVWNGAPSAPDDPTGYRTLRPESP